MKITVKELRGMIREAIQKEMFPGGSGGEASGKFTGLAGKSPARGVATTPVHDLTPEETMAVKQAAKSDPILRAAMAKLGLL